MLFNSIEFCIFLPIVFLSYWSISKEKVKFRNILLLCSSYVFYGWWDWRFLSLIIFSSVVDYLCGVYLKEFQSEKQRKYIVYVSLLVNLGILGFFKYFNFFIDNFVEAFSFFGMALDPKRLKIILPVGISFYTFQTLSYTIDVYKRKIEPSKDCIAFFCYVAFFPQLVAGPIERAAHLLPQFFDQHIFRYEKAVKGMRYILWGFFKKVVIADNCAYYVNLIFSDYSSQSGSTLTLGVIYFAFQIYGDFSGYSDIAIGTAHLFGFDLRKNFDFPYFSRNIAEFWKRWHISLSLWFRDYVYFSLGGSYGSLNATVRNVFIVFLLSGLWHGAKWNFIVWGGLHACLFIPFIFIKHHKKYTSIVAQDSFFPTLKEIFQIIITFLVVCIGWVFFRSENLIQSMDYLNIIFSYSFFTIPDYLARRVICLLIVFITIEWIQRKKLHCLDFNPKKTPKYMRWILYYSLVFFLFWFSDLESKNFIYFQF